MSYIQVGHAAFERPVITIGLILLLCLFRPSCHLSPPAADKNTATERHAQEIQGIDISHYQGTIKWQSLPPAIEFVIIKATEGLTYTDPLLAEHINGASAKPIPWGAYHFFRPKDDAATQAEHFLAATGHWQSPLRPILDIEVVDGVDSETLRKGVQTWIEQVTAARGCAPLIYASRTFYDDYLGEAFDSTAFWLAEYSGNLVLPKSRTDWLLWQYKQNGRVAGVSNAVDQNRLNAYKTLEDLRCNSVGTNL